MKIKQWVLAAIMMTSGLGMLSSCQQIVEEQLQEVACQWVADYAEEGVDPETGLTDNRVVEVYEFLDNNTGYYECYLLNGDELVNAEYVRGENGDFHYEVEGGLDYRSTIKQRKMDVCLDIKIVLLDWSYWWTVRYDDGLLDDGYHVLTPATEAQRAQILKWYESRHNTDIAEKIIGKWIEAEINGQPALTNDKTVTTFLSDTKATLSTSRTNFSETQVQWSAHLVLDVNISGNKMTLTRHPDDNVTIVQEYSVTAIDDAQMSANFKHTRFLNGETISHKEQNNRYAKVTADYSEAVLGLWECTELTGIETYNDANARLEFLADGTYRYYRVDDAGQWQAVTSREFQDYFVDGTLLATRWKNEGEEELREWWEIASIADGQMVWTALRQNADSSTVQQGMKWEKIEM